MLQIDYRSGDALYVQIKSNFKRVILSGSLKPSAFSIFHNIDIDLGDIIL